MYTSFTIENFRLFDRLTIEPLARVNLIVGKNDAGKTALLEALWLHSQPGPRTAQRLGNWRGIPITESEVLFADLFHNYQTNLAIRTASKGDLGSGLVSPHSYQPPMSSLSNLEGGVQTTLNVSCDDLDEVVTFEYFNEATSRKSVAKARRYYDLDDERNIYRHRIQIDGRLPDTEYGPAVFIPTSQSTFAGDVASKFGRSVIAGHIDNVQRVMQVVVPRLQKLTAIPKERGPAMIYADVGIGRLIPMSIMGDGVRRLLNLALSFNDAGNGVIFIDEIENGIHYSALQGVWEGINRFSRQFNVQVFATTHSYECVEAANNAFHEMGSNELYLHRLHRQGNLMKATTYKKEALDINIEYLWEMR